MKFTPEKMRAVMALPAAKRYSHFIKVAADQNCVWGLYADGWALMGTADGSQVFPVWPAEPYAASFATHEWSSFTPRRIEMTFFLEELLPSLRKSQTLLGVFPTNGDKASTPELSVVEADIRTELSRIE